MNRLSVIVPVYNEEESIPRFLDRAVEWDCVSELLFVDGGSMDRTLEMLEGLDVLHSAKGRGAQCRLGAEHATGDALVFVHGDSMVPAESMRAIWRALDAGVLWGSLTLRFTTNTLDRKIGSWAANARVRRSGIPFGDQTIFVQRTLYDQVGGMPDIPIMEDYELSRRLKAICWPKQLPEKVYTSPRRFESGGNVRIMFQMRHLRHLYRKGVDIDEIARIYGEGRKQGV
ncbi:MAG: TIGR04283 family arsenosugar biosynthesis glycosyltransferase [Eggerthellaceae bacterium]|nr:TIGR04283 family arsenosugar biosynthesis glycosyltransferase [Eggerthellaceae bacterium]